MLYNHGLVLFEKVLNIKKGLKKTYGNKPNVPVFKCLMKLGGGTL